MFTKRTIKKQEVVTSVDTASEALTVSLSEKARIDLDYMSALSGKSSEKIIVELQGIIFLNPLSDKWETADEYLSGNVREKLKTARLFAEKNPEYASNVKALEGVQPQELEAADIEVRLGATWIDTKYINQFMQDVFKTPKHMFMHDAIGVQFSKSTCEWNIKGKMPTMAILLLIRHLDLPEPTHIRS